MDLREHYRRQIRSGIRSGAWSSGIAAALMLWYGFIGGGFIVPDKGGIYVAACKAFIFTVRAGGVVMATITLSALLGLRFTPAVEAVASAIIGAVFVLSGAVQVLHADMMALFYVIFGAMFLHSARSSWQRFQWIRESGSQGELPEWQDYPPVPPGRSVASDLIERMRGPARAESVPRPARPPTPAPAATTGPIPTGAHPDRATTPPAQESKPGNPPGTKPVHPKPKAPDPSPPPPGGFLAALAKEDDEQK